MSVDRASVVAVIVAVRERLLGGEEGGEEAIAEAASARGISVDAFQSGLAADPDLARLFAETMREATVEPPDPGPYAEISRESSRGAPDPIPDAFARDAKLLDPRR